VLDAGGDAVGRLTDLAVVPGEQLPVVRWAVIATGAGERVVRWRDLAIEPAHLRLRRRLEGIPPEALPGEALRLASVLDADATAGGAAVKVNDLRLEETAGELRLLGADVGWRGLWRRIGLEGAALLVARLAGRRPAETLVPWHELALGECRVS